MRNINSKFWYDKTVFITGHTGFKGAWLAYFLHSLGAKVHGYSLAVEQHHQFYEKTGLGSMIASSSISDIRNRENLLRAVKEAAPDVVFHLAAQPLVQSGYKDPLYTFDVNIIGTANILDVAISMQRQMAVLCITTDKVYENQEHIWSYREPDRLGGSDPYSASKACAEIVIESYLKGISEPNGSKIGIASARAGNVIGGGDWSAGRLIPDFMNSVYFEKKLSIRNPNAIRPWQHVLDCLTGYLLLAESLYEDPKRNSEAWNFGPQAGTEWSVEMVIDYLASKTNKKPIIEYKIGSELKMKEHTSLSLDSTKATKRLHWQPRLSTAEALDYTIREYTSTDSEKGFLKAVEKSIECFLSNGASHVD